MPEEPTVFCMSVTPFTSTLAFDEDEYRKHLKRLVDSGVGVYFASPGSGEGHSLSNDELRQIYRIGVETCKGKVPTCANIPEARNAQQLLEKARLAMDAGVDVVQIYTVDPGHGMRPTEAEQEAFYREVLHEIDYAVGLSVNLLAGGYVTPINLLKRLCYDYPKIVFINVLQPPTSYLAELMDAIGPRIAFYSAAEMLAECLTLGGKGCLTGHANVVPFLVRSIGRHYVAGRMEKCGQSLMQLFRLNKAVAQFGLDTSAPPQWSARWLKSAMKVLDVPGHSEGRMRPPYLSPSREDIELLGSMLRSIDVAAMEGRARELR